MNKLVISVLLLILSTTVIAQTGTVKGNITDAKSNESLIGTTVMLKGTTIGTITDFDGNYMIPKVDVGKHTLVISFISYDPQEIEIEVKPNEETVVNVALQPATIEVEGVEVVAKANRETENMLLLDQKNSSGIKESIGSKRLSSLGVSDAAGATTKISGVTKNEGSGDVYIRGLGDRYLSTTMNGLPIPSDDVEKKNIDLNLFSTDVIKNVGINKTYTTESYADQSSGNVDISSKTLSEKITLKVGGGTNTAILSNGVFGNFKGTQNLNDITFGFYQAPYTTKDAIMYQSWNTVDRSFPLDRSFGILGGKKIKLFNRDFSVFVTASHSNSSQFETGIYKNYRSNVLDKSYTDAENYVSEYNTTGLLNLAYDFNKDHSINFNSLVVFKTIDQL